MKRLFSSRQSGPLLFGAVVLALVTFLLVRGGNRAVDGVAASTGATGARGERELVTIRLESRWKLKRASWGPVTVPEPPPQEPPEPDEAPPAPQHQGLDIAVVGR